METVSVLIFWRKGQSLEIIASSFVLHFDESRYDQSFNAIVDVTDLVSNPLFSTNILSGVSNLCNACNTGLCGFSSILCISLLIKPLSIRSPD